MAKKCVRKSFRRYIRHLIGIYLICVILCFLSHLKWWDLGLNLPVRVTEDVIIVVSINLLNHSVISSCVREGPWLSQLSTNRNKSAHDKITLLWRNWLEGILFHTKLVISLDYRPYALKRYKLRFTQHNNWLFASLHYLQISTFSKGSFKTVKIVDLKCLL